MVTEEWNEDMMAAVTGPPSRNHWKVSTIVFLSCISSLVLHFGLSGFGISWIYNTLTATEKPGNRQWKKYGLQNGFGRSSADDHFI
jgi:hypothetical protein